MRTPRARRAKIPPDPQDDYAPHAAEARRAFLRAQTGAGLEHVSRYSFDPSILPGNVEHFTGVAQVPIGIAGPLLVNGEHARGEFYVPLDTQVIDTRLGVRLSARVLPPGRRGQSPRRSG